MDPHITPAHPTQDNMGTIMANYLKHMEHIETEVHQLRSELELLRHKMGIFQLQVGTSIHADDLPLTQRRVDKP